MNRIAFLPLLALGITACDDTMQPPLGDTLALTATATGSPFVGSWAGIDKTDDNSNVHVMISKDGPDGVFTVRLLDDAFSSCGGLRGVLSAEGAIVAENLMKLSGAVARCQGNLVIPLGIF